MSVQGNEYESRWLIHDKGIKKKYMAKVESSFWRQAGTAIYLRLVCLCFINVPSWTNLCIHNLVTSRIEPVFAHHSCNWNEFISASDNLSEWIGLNNRRSDNRKRLFKASEKEKEIWFVCWDSSKGRVQLCCSKVCKIFFPLWLCVSWGHVNSTWTYDMWPECYIYM